jgi:exopolyphosphatase/guanosine-5'-triphosphate,3'-diphosphate pyrophosphatase
MAPRWEWRTFGGELGLAERRLGAPERITESDETYLLAPEAVAAVKLRDGLMDVKHREQVDANGLELWKPVMKAPLPIGADEAGFVLAALGIAVPRLEGDAYGLAELAAASAALTLVPVHKTRRHVVFGDCRAEVTDITTEGGSVRTIAVEDEDPARVLAAVRELGLGDRPNVSVPRGLRALLAAASRTSGGRTARR